MSIESIKAEIAANEERQLVLYRQLRLTSEEIESLRHESESLKIKLRREELTTSIGTPVKICRRGDELDGTSGELLAVRRTRCSVMIGDAKWSLPIWDIEIPKGRTTA